MTKEWDLKEHFGPNTDRVELTLQLGTASVPNTESKETSKETSKESNSEKVKDLMRGNKRITIKEMAEAEKVVASYLDREKGRFSNRMCDAMKMHHQVKNPPSKRTKMIQKMTQ